ncbi:cytochrome aa3 quinol oxidase subunit IV [Bacillaceae bacterium SIJ1]|uniref:cytochrome aa3 quinol oxidase subunit IV n=1 Tax=Litoribacterium kuwaitense TaxID=1398745 RepID=UPI0013EC36F3|nr:cytochrome aa3 quinol oxidase subunit IV [Litoribacterium kuwaitense]NGP45421.1 cytochrome aa3 quinol oxidase subunit IV [Litoribacterium kuwaitense]
MEQTNTVTKKSHFPWKHIIGFVLSIVFTLAAVWVSFGTDLSLDAKVWAIFIFAFIQAGLQLFLFMHVSEGKAGAIQVGNLLFAIFITLVIVVGSIWVLNFGVHLHHHM